MMRDIAAEHRQLAGIERHWLDDAIKDYNYNHNHAWHFCAIGDRPRCRFYSDEARKDLHWVNIRGKIIAREDRLGRRG
jgi:hypothetical protein